MDLGLLWVLGVLMAAALAAGGLGSVFRLPKVTSYLLMCELGLTFVLVYGGVWALGLAWPGALLLAALALATAPATTILVLKEYESEGPVTESIYAMVAVNNGAAIVLFDPSIGSLVRAADLTTAPGRVLHPDDTVDRACEIFSSRKDDCIPVVTREEPRKFLGLVRRRDILRMLFRGRDDG